MGESVDEKEGTTEVEPKRLPSPPGGVSRVDTLPEEFCKFLSRRPLLSGDVVGNSRFKLLQELGQGAMGQVFTAENQAIGRVVAVKVLKPELLADASFRRRFQHEAMAIAAVEHRNVVRFFDLVVGDPTFLVMEYARGPTLTAVLKEHKKLDVARAVNIATRLGWALDAVHQAGIVHRDIKPGNVILSPDPELGEEPKLIDFGLAKLATLPPEEQLTRAGQVVGTPHYMSPEQIANKDIDARSDVYSFGCLLYHLLAGRPPFAGDDDMQVLYQQIHHDPEPIRHRLPEVPLELDAIVMHALAKAPLARFQSMREVLAALASVERRHAAPELAAARSESTEVVRPRRAPLVVALGLTAAALALAVAGWWPRLATRNGGLLIVTSRPQGAAVALDGKRLAEPTPTAVRGLSPGVHRVRLEQPGREPVEQLVDVTARGSAALDVPLPPASRALQITSVPSGATVFLDGSQVPGETPLMLSIADDDFHELRLEKLGFEPEKQGLSPEERGPVVVSLAPEQRPRGRVWVDSNSSAEVVIDGKDTSYNTPTIGIAVSAGEHQIALRDSTGQTTAPTNITVRRGETLHLTLSAPGACKSAAP